MQYSKAAPLLNSLFEALPDFYFGVHDLPVIGGFSVQVYAMPCSKCADKEWCIDGNRQENKEKEETPVFISSVQRARIGAELTKATFINVCTASRLLTAVLSEQIPSKTFSTWIEFTGLSLEETRQCIIRYFPDIKREIKKRFTPRPEFEINRRFHCGTLARTGISRMFAKPATSTNVDIRRFALSFDGVDISREVQRLGEQGIKPEKDFEAVTRSAARRARLEAEAAVSEPEPVPEDPPVPAIVVRGPVEDRVADLAGRGVTPEEVRNFLDSIGDLGRQFFEYHDPRYIERNRRARVDEDQQEMKTVFADDFDNIGTDLRNKMPKFPRGTIGREVVRKALLSTVQCGGDRLRPGRVPGDPKTCFELGLNKGYAAAINRR